MYALPELTANERREMCEEGYCISFDLYDMGEYEKALKFFLNAIDIYTEEGTSEWYVTIGDAEKNLLKNLCDELDKSEIYEEYLEKIVNISTY